MFLEAREAELHDQMTRIKSARAEGTNEKANYAIARVEGEVKGIREEYIIWLIYRNYDIMLIY